MVASDKNASEEQAAGSDHEGEQETGGPTEQEKELGVQAITEYKKNNYGACLQILEKLRGLRPTDIKVLHNEAFLEFCKMGETKLEQIRNAFRTIAQRNGIRIEEPESLEELEHCILYYNYAVILYHLRQYRQASTILNKLFSFAEPLDVWLGQGICFLLLDVCLRLKQAERMLSLVSYIENTFLGSSTESVVLPASGSSGATHIGKVGGEAWSRVLLQGSKEPVGPRLPRDGWTDVHRTKLIQYRVRALLMLGNKVLARNHIREDKTLEWISLSSNLEYLEGNAEKAVEHLNSIPRPLPTFSESIEVLYYNNLGCIHLKIGKPHLSVFYLQKALAANNAVTAKSGNKEQNFLCKSGNRVWELSYNVGVALLHAGRPQAAFDFLLEAAQAYPSNSQLWLRLAEACIRSHKSDNHEDFKSAQQKRGLVQGQIGTGDHKKLVLASALNKQYEGGESGAIPMLSLGFASLCLRNALSLLPETPQPESYYNMSPSDPVNGSAIIFLRCNILACSAYVSLTLGDPVMALQHAHLLLTQPNLPGAYNVLGHLYTSEALVLLDRIGEAKEHLNPELVMDTELCPEAFSTGIKDHNWFPSNIQSVRVIFLYNLAVAYALRGELSRSTECVTQLSRHSGELPIQLYMLALYIQIQLGHADIAKNMIKTKHCPQYS